MSYAYSLRCEKCTFSQRRLSYANALLRGYRHVDKTKHTVVMREQTERTLRTVLHMTPGTKPVESNQPEF